MCGIAGIVDTRVAPDLRRASVQAMCDAMRHRGPDDAGFVDEGAVTLGMRRLSIVDLPGGHQPIANESGRAWIVFNGEIYNHRDLRPPLEARGHRMATASDTEVILHQYEEDGAACVHRLNGMFAFAIWDADARRLLLARDRLGVKPLYYTWDGSRLMFASEIKALLAIPGAPRDLNEEALWHYLTFRYVPQPMTIWRHIWKLPPGHTLTLDGDGSAPRLDRYWEVPFGQPVRELDEAAAVSEFEALFGDSVARRLVADVPVGVLLSGGLDSSAVAAASALAGAGALNSFSIAFDDPAAVDETPYARTVAAAFGLSHHEIRIGHDEFTRFLPDYVRMADEPLADLAAVPLFFVSRLARQTVKVVLSGEGSDEILAGYDFDRVVQRWQGAVARQRWNGLAEVAAAVAEPLSAAMAGRLRRATASPALERWPVAMTEYLSSAEKRELMIRPVSARDSLALLADEQGRHPDGPLLHRVLYSYCQSWLVEDLLMKADKMTMANSLELRVPFLDYRLVEWAAAAPVSTKIGPGPDGRLETKHVLRAWARRRLPAEIVARPKYGFPVPAYAWLSTHLREWARSLLLDGALLTRWLRPEAIERAVKLGTSDRASTLARHRLWNLLVLELWLREWRPA